MADLTHDERKRIRRAAEDARDAANRHYGPFVDVVAHPLNMLALLDMADRAAAQGRDAEPLFWYRPRSDSLYEGPIHNASIERVRKESGAWVPLFVGRPPSAQADLRNELNCLGMIASTAMHQPTSDQRNILEDLADRLLALAGGSAQSEPESEATQSRSSKQAVTPELAALAWQRAVTDGDDAGDMSLRVARHVAALLGAQAEPVSGADRLPSTKHDLNTSAGGRGFVAEYFQKRIGRHDFNRYITDRLAADFACCLAQHLAAQAKPPVSQPLPNERDADAIVSALYRRFKDWSKRGFGPDDVTWCEVKADVLALLAQQASGQNREDAAYRRGLRDGRLEGDGLTKACLA